MMKIAVILRPTASSFALIAGLPLIQRTILSARRCGFDRIMMMGGAYTEQLHIMLNADARLGGVEILDQLPGLAASVAHESVIAVIPSDCVLTTATLMHVTAADLDDRPLLFTSPSMSVLALCRPAMLTSLDSRALEGNGAAPIWAALRRQGACSIALTGDVCVRITDPRSIVRAEQALCRQLRAQTAASDGPLAHAIDRHISLRISRWLVRHTSLSPNHITVIGTCIGLFGAIALGVGTYWTGIIGTLLFLCATIVDGCDGEVARLTFLESSFGQRFDVVTDNVVHIAIFVGLAVGLYRRYPAGHYLWLMAILLGGFACTLVVTYVFLVRRPGFAHRETAPVSFKGRLRGWLLRGFEALMNRDFAYLLVVLAVLDRLYWFVWGTAFGTYLFAILLVWIYRWRDAA